MSLSLSYAGHVIRKRFSQNFLVDESVIFEMIAEIAPKRHDLICEIGPGLGALTSHLFNAINSNFSLEEQDLGLNISRLSVIEIDKALVKKLHLSYGDKINIFSGDALQFDFQKLYDSLRVGKEEVKFRVVGNLPYNISTPLLFHLHKSIDFVTDQCFMLQKEVVDRIVASPGTKSYGRLSVILQQQYYIERLFDILPSAFFPVPKVTSSFIRMIPREFVERNSVNTKIFNFLVCQAFSQRRKKLRNTLARFASVIPLKNLGIDLDQRAEEVAVDEYVAMAKKIPDIDYFQK